MSKVLTYYSCYSGTTDVLTGTGNLSIQIPDTYTGTTIIDAGRTIVSATIQFANPLDGDKISSISVTDTNGVMPQSDQVLFPLYPTLGIYGDPGVPAANKVMFLNTGGSPTTFIPASGTVFIPSQMYINITVQKASLLADTFYINMTWTKLSP